MSVLCMKGPPFFILAALLSIVAFKSAQSQCVEKKCNIVNAYAKKEGAIHRCFELSRSDCVICERFWCLPALNTKTTDCNPIGIKLKRRRCKDADCKPQCLKQTDGVQGAANCEGIGEFEDLERDAKQCAAPKGSK